MKYLEHFAKNLKFFRNEKHLTQAELAEKLNVHVSTIARIETAEHQVSAKNIDNIIKILEVSYGEFFDYYEPDEINLAKREIIEKIIKLTKVMSIEDLQHFLFSMESYIATQKSKR